MPRGYGQHSVTGDRTEALSFTEIDTLGSQEGGIMHCTYGAMTPVAAQDELLSPPWPRETAARPFALDQRHIVTWQARSRTRNCRTVFAC